MKSTSSLSFLLASLLAVAGAVQAQGSPAATSDVPSKAGEASTMTQGKPNAVTTNQTASEQSTVSKDQIRQDAKVKSRTAVTSNVPPQAGEASTMVKGKPNAMADDPMLTKSRAERRSEREIKRADARQRRDAAVMGQKGAQVGSPAGTPQVSPAGTPSVFEGGTPK
jgi:hypothetical protein